MKLLLTITLAIILTSCWSSKTHEQIEYAKWEITQAQIEVDKQRAFQLEKAKVEAQMEASKPESVQLQAEKNKETTIWEWVESAAMWMGWAAVGLWILHMIQ